MRYWEFIHEVVDPRENDPRIIQDVKDAYDMGYTVEQTVQLLGITYSSVQRILKKNYPDRVSTTRARRPNELADMVISRIKQGLPRKLIAKELDITTNQINNLLNNYYKDRPEKRVIRPNIIDSMSDLEKQEIIGRWQQGESVYQLSAETGAHPNAIKALLIQAIGPEELDKRAKKLGNRPIIPDNVMLDIIAAYKAGRGISDISRQYGVMPNAIKYHLTKLGLYTTSAKSPLNAKNIADAKLWRNQGYSITAIANKLGLDIGPARYWLRIAGIT